MGVIQGRGSSKALGSLSLLSCSLVSRGEVRVRCRGKVRGYGEGVRCRVKVQRGKVQRGKVQRERIVESLPQVCASVL